MAGMHNDDNTPQGLGQVAKMATATRPGLFPNDNEGGERSEGETSGVGSVYSATLAQRENKSNMRNQGPSRASSRMGSSTIPVLTQGARKTGRVGG